MPKLPDKLNPANITPAHVSGLMRFWNSIRSFSVQEIQAEAERPIHLALVGSDDYTALLAARLALETPVPRDSIHGPANIQPYISFHTGPETAPEGSLRLAADPLTSDETHLAAVLTQIVTDYPALRLSLARHIPAFRPAVTTRLINDASVGNAKIAVMSALPGIIPMTDVLMPVTAIGDMVLLTRHQASLLLQVAAAYGLPIDMRARMKELLPVVGGAFGWRAVARELVGLVPGGVGVAIKGGIAYAGTYTVGKAAMIYYSTGQTLSKPRLKQLYRDALGEAKTRVQSLIRRPRAALPASSTDLT